MCPVSISHLVLWQALAEFRLSQPQYEELMALSTRHPSLDFDPGQVACRWMRRNTNTLMDQWLIRIRPTNMIHLAGIFPIFPIKSSSYQDPGVIPGKGPCIWSVI